MSVQDFQSRLAAVVLFRDWVVISHNLGTNISYKLTVVKHLLRTNHVQCSKCGDVFPQFELVKCGIGERISMMSILVRLLDNVPIVPRHTIVSNLISDICGKESAAYFKVLFTNNLEDPKLGLECLVFGFKLSDSGVLALEFNIAVPLLCQCLTSCQTI